MASRHVDMPTPRSQLLLMIGLLSVAVARPHPGGEAAPSTPCPHVIWKGTPIHNRYTSSRLWLPDALVFAREESNGHLTWLRADFSSGTINPAWDADVVARSLAQLGLSADAHHLELAGLHVVSHEPRFFAEGRIFAIHPQGVTEVDHATACRDLRRIALPNDAHARSSHNGGEPVRVHVINFSDKPVTLHWIEPRDTSQPISTCKPGESIDVFSFNGHALECRTQAGQSLWRGMAKDNGIILASPSPAPAEASIPPTEPGHRERRVLIAKNNVWLDDTALTHDGTSQKPYAAPTLSPDQSHGVGLRFDRVEPRRITLVESSPPGQVQPRTEQVVYPKPGDPVDQASPWLIDTTTGACIPVDAAPFMDAFEVSFLDWTPNGDEALFLRNQRGHQCLQVLAVSAADGRVRRVVDERSATFIDYAHKTHAEILPKRHALLWMSERDGWNHLWMYDLKGAKAPKQVTSGPWVVRSVERVDEEHGEVLVSACGFFPTQDPYHIHLLRCPLDGGPAQPLTAGDGTHTWTFSPDGHYLLDTWSRVDQPPVHELRRMKDGSLVCELTRADDTALRAKGWRPPERFVAKGRDGKTDIWGVLYRPSGWKPGTRLPVVEETYPGPHDQYVPKRFGEQRRPEEIAAEGYAVAIIDGMGTNWRSRAFHDVCWKNLKDAGAPDHVAWLKAAAAAHPELDLSRMAIYGGSAGGQAALASLLHHGDFYKIAIADCGCHDNRMDKIWWNEAWMGWPVGPEYADNSNVTHAGKLQGDLLLTVGELDHNVDPASTMQVVNALMKAGKDFEYLCVPGAGHFTLDRPEVRQKMLDFLRRKIGAP